MENKTFTRKELYDLVWSESLPSLSRKFGISDNGLRKICIKMNIPLPQAGHWNKLKAGKSVFIRKLPESYAEENEISLAYRIGEKTFTKSPLIELASQIKNDPQIKIEVPLKLTNPDKLVLAAKESLKQKQNRSPYVGVISCSPNELDIRIAPENVNRSLCFIDTLIKVLRKRGHEIKIKNNSTYAIVKNQEVKICLKERLKKAIRKNVYGSEHTEYNPTGILYFKMEGYNGKEWIDGKVKLEDQIPSIIAKMEVESQCITEMKLENEKRWQEQREKQRKQREIEEKKENELFLFKEALAKASRWHKANNLRNYIKAFEENCYSTNALTEENKLWLEWAKKKADWYDPFIEMEDPLLRDVDRNSLLTKLNTSSGRINW